MSFPSDWPQTFGVDVASAFPPGLGARMRWFERIAPQPRFGAIVKQVLGLDPAFQIEQVGAVVRAVTLEGEYAALIAITGQRDGRPALRVVGAVFLDHFAAALDCIAIDPMRFAEVHHLAFELVRHARFALVARPRPFFYVPPRDWQGIPSRHTANWYPPAFPRERAVLSISHAEALASTLTVETLDTSELESGLVIGESAREPLVLEGGRAGLYVRVRGTRGEHLLPVQRELALFVIDQRAYRFRLETSSGANVPVAQAALRAAVESFAPLPKAEAMRSGVAFGPAHGGMSLAHWVT